MYTIDNYSTYRGNRASSRPLGLTVPGKGTAWSRLWHLAARLVIEWSGHLCKLIV